MRYIYLACLFSAISISVSAQGLINFDSEEIEKDFIKNMDLYAAGYTAPILGSFSFSQVNAWQYDAELLNPWAFRIGIVASAAFARPDNITFNFNQVGFTDNLELKEPGDPTLVSALGGETDAIFVYTVEADNGTRYAQEIPAFAGFSSPNNAIPNAVPQFSLGLPGDFEVSARFLPFIQIDDVTHSEFGVGLKHNVGKYFTDNEKLKISAGAFYDVNQFNYEPVDFLEGEEQNVQLISNAFLVESAVSYRLGFLSVVGALGVYTMQNSFNIEGTYRYEVETSGVLGQPVVQEAFSTTDPISISENISGLRLSAALNVNLGDWADLNLGYHLAQVSTVSASLGFCLFNNKKGE